MHDIDMLIKNKFLPNSIDTIPRKHVFIWRETNC